MMKRSFVLALAAGLIASVAFSSPSQAGPTLVTTTGFFSLTPAGATATEWDYFYKDGSGNPLASMTGLTVTNTGGLTITNGGGNGVIVGTNEAVFMFTAANHTTGTGSPLTAGLQFTFNTSNLPSDVFQGPVNLVSTGATHTTNISGITATAGGVPEPASLALLGIGMTGFLAFRRFFKKTSVA